MTINEIEREKRRQQRFECLGVDTPVCVVCGETDERCLERHHIAGRAYHDAEAIICRNCHRKLSDDQRDHPNATASPPHQLECIGHFLIGVADLFLLLAEKLYQFGHDLVDMVQETSAASNQEPA